MEKLKTQDFGLEDVNNFLDCIANYECCKYMSPCGYNLKCLQTPIENVKESFIALKRQEIMDWEQAYPGEASQAEDLLRYLEHGIWLDELPLSAVLDNTCQKFAQTTMDEDGTIHTREYLANEGNSLNFWFSTVTLKNNIRKLKTDVRLKKAVFECLDKLFKQDGYDFSFCNPSHGLEIPKFYDIKNEFPQLGCPFYDCRLSYHFFICFKDKTYVLEFYFHYE
jgi:hypothetical protein